MEEQKSVWTVFWDMNSDGGTKEKTYDNIYIEAPREEAVSIFYSRFGHNPYRVSCTCCGEDYSVDESPSLEQATGFHRNCAFDKETKQYIEKQGLYGTYNTLEEYMKREDMLVIYAKDIQDKERKSYVPRQGYVWMDEADDY